MFLKAANVSPQREGKQCLLFLHPPPLSYMGVTKKCQSTFTNVYFVSELEAVLIPFVKFFIY